jgi:pyridoxine kinase
MQEQQQEQQRVLSIQSHVVSGYVGNKAAVFPLQLLGFDVDIINSVHFSNHTGHPNGFEGQVMDGDQLTSVLNGLERNNLLSNIHHLVTGYIGSVTFLRSVLNVLQTLKKYNPNVRYVCDPVLGDDGKLYVPRELVSIFRTEVVPLANVVTPNQFEAELLTGITIQSMEDGIKACQAMHDLGPDLVVITSMTLEEVDEKVGQIAILASERVRNEESDLEEIHMWTINTPKIPGRFTGTGDLTTALFLAWTAKLKNLKETLEKVASTMYAVIKYTAEGSDDSVVSKELKLIQCKGIIENPNVVFQAQKLD